MENKDTAKALNQLLQGEHMAIEVFDKFISKADSNSVKRTFIEVKKFHRENIENLGRHITNMGAKPRHTKGLSGKIGELMLDIELMGKKDSKHLVEKAIEGVYKGINKAEQITRGNLDNDSRILVGNVLKKDRNSLMMLQNLH